MSDPKIELNAGQSPRLNDIIARLALSGVNIDTAELQMGYMRSSTPLLGEIRTAAVIAIDDDGIAAEIAHMPLHDLDPITLDEQIIEDVLRTGTDVVTNESEIEIHDLAHRIVAALRAGTTQKETP